MIYLRVFIFLFFGVALIGSLDCLFDSARVNEHSGAFISMYICILGCALSFVNPDNIGF